nr:PREDICTED: ADAMTS-like protein 3 isoform X1 [Equus przewalskii]
MKMNFSLSPPTYATMVCGDQSQGAVFLREFTLIRRESLHEDFLSDLLNSHKTEDSSSRTARSEEDRDGLWDAWGPWSECSRTCGGGASYSLRRCLSSKFRHPSSIQSPNTLRKAQRL